MKIASLDARSVLVPMSEPHRTASGVIEASSHLWPEISAQLLTATPTARWLEYAHWWNPIPKNPLKLREGMADIEGVLASGVEFDEDAVRKYIA